MVDATIQHELCTMLGLLPVAQQHQVLEFARALATSRIQGVPGANLLRFVGMIGESDLDEMSRAIEDGCERIDADEW